MADAERYSRRRLLATTGTVATAAAFAACRPEPMVERLNTPPSEYIVRVADKPLTEEQRRIHFPMVNGKEVPAIPYFSVPFISGTPFTIEETYFYSRHERELWGTPTHYGSDFAANFRTKVVMPEDGHVWYGYQLSWLYEDPARKIIRKNPQTGKPIRFSLGLFANAYFPSVNRFVQFAHFSEQVEGIPLHPPTYNEALDNWMPAPLNILVEDIPKRADIVHVKKGQVIGFVGTSGLGEGDKETFKYDSSKKMMVPMEPGDNDATDEPHVHAEDFWRDPQSGLKVARRDLLGRYEPVENCIDPTGKVITIGKDALVVVKNGKLAYAA